MPPTAEPDRRVKLYARSHRRWREVINDADAVFNSVWLGLLDAESRARLDEGFFVDRRESLGDGAAAYVDDDWNTSGLQDWEAAVIERHFAASGRVVVTGAGGGREIVALLGRGYDAVGWEPNAHLVAAGVDLLARLGERDRLWVSAREGFPPDAGPADAVIAGWGSYMLMAGRDRRVAWLRGARAVLEPGAPLLVSFFTRPEGTRRFDKMAAIANLIRRLRRDELVEPGDVLSPNYLHKFVRAEIAAELAAGGFELVAYADEPYGHAIARAA